MNNATLIYTGMDAQSGARFAVSGVVLPANNGPISVADTRIPSNDNGLPNIQGCH